MISKKALILSGGSIRGAFQAGAIKAVLESGFEPDIIQGISAGALNGAVLVNETGLKRDSATKWQDAGEALEEIWLNNICKPSDIIIKRKKLKLGFQALFNRFKGVVKTGPLKTLVHRLIKESNLRNSEVKFLLGAVDLLEGDIEYRNNRSSMNLVDFVLASASIPIILPLTYIGSRPYYDGGLRDSAPLKHVIAEGADELVIILTQPKRLEDLTRDAGFNQKNILHLVERIVNIALHEMLENDLEMLEKINTLLIEAENSRNKPKLGLIQGKRVIKTTLIRPNDNYPVGIDSFTKEDIHNMFHEGYSIANEHLKVQQIEIAA